MHQGKRCAVGSLINSVMKTWNEGELDEMITNVYDRLRNVSAIIIEGDGANDLVETKRGVKWRKMGLPEEKENEQPTSTSVTVECDWTEMSLEDIKEEDV